MKQPNIVIKVDICKPLLFVADGFQRMRMTLLFTRGQNGERLSFVFSTTLTEQTRRTQRYRWPSQSLSGIFVEGDILKIWTHNEFGEPSWCHLQNSWEKYSNPVGCTGFCLVKVQTVAATSQCLSLCPKSFRLNLRMMLETKMLTTNLTWNIKKV